MAMMAITTNSSMRVKALWLETSTKWGWVVFMFLQLRGF
jgi:hypothetical protein